MSNEIAIYSNPSCSIKSTLPGSLANPMQYGQCTALDSSLGSDAILSGYVNCANGTKQPQISLFKGLLCSTTNGVFFAPKGSSDTSCVQILNRTVHNVDGYINQVCVVGGDFSAIKQGSNSASSPSDTRANPGSSPSDTGSNLGNPTSGNNGLPVWAAVLIAVISLVVAIFGVIRARIYFKTEKLKTKSKLQGEK